MQRLAGAIFQQDNARSHTTRASQDCFRTVTTFPWPARSPDLSPIDHILNHLGRRIGHPTSLNELEARLQQIWNEMSQNIFQNLYASMPDSIGLCIRPRGGSTESTIKSYLAEASQIKSKTCSDEVYFLMNMISVRMYHVDTKSGAQVQSPLDFVCRL
ncbi:transposable element Tcb1 transposase [Trichonephila clavipes]|nr:transposable element Tcb1 transposase [Trichonephila clavipes]